MGITTDRVVVILEAKLDQYSNNVRRAEAQFGKSLGNMRTSSANLERQISRDAGSIASTMRGLAGTIASAFGVREVAALADTWTRYTNRLKTAGLEGTALATTQSRLLEIANKNGVEIEALGTMYGRLAISADELGASTSDLEGVSRAVAAALRIQGTSTEEARGGLLQLSQAIASPRVEMEEFGSVLDSMPALVTELAKRIPEAGGSVAKLRNLIKDRKGAGLSGGTLFSAILDSLDALEEKSKSAQLTIGNSFVVLGNQLAQYVGLADDGVGATEAISGAIIKLSENLDTVVPALTTIISLIVGRYVGGVAAATVANTSNAVSMLRGAQAANAYAAAISRLAIAQGIGGAQGARMAAGIIAQSGAMATATGIAGGLGRALLGAFGGPVGLAVTALTVGLGYYATSAMGAADATDESAKALERQGKAAEYAANLSDKLRRMTDAERLATLNALKAARAKAAQDILSAKAALKRAAAELALAKSMNYKAAFTPGGGSVAGSADFIANQSVKTSPKIKKLEGDVDSLTKSISSMEDSVAKLDAGIGAVGDYQAATPSAATGGGSGKSGGATRRKEAEDRRAKIAERAAEEEARLAREELEAKIALTTDIAQKADLQKDLLQMEYEERVKQVQNDEDYTQAQKDAQIAALRRLYGQPSKAGPGGIETQGPISPYAQQIMKDLEREQLRLANDMKDRAASTLEAMASIETSNKRRAELETEALEIRQEIERSLLEQQIANGEIADADQAQALLAKQQAAAREGLRKSQQGPGSRYVEDLQGVAENINDAIDGIKIRGLEQLNDELVDAIMGAKSLGQAFSNVAKSIIADLLRIAIQQAVIRPLAENLFGGGGGFGSSLGAGLGSLSGGGGGGGLFSGLSKVFGSLFGRASGGHVQAGQVYPVGEKGIELFQPSQSGKIIPNGQLAPQGGMSQKAVVELRVARGEMFEAYVTEISGQVSVQTLTQAGPAFVEAASNETLRQLSRPKM